MDGIPVIIVDNTGSFLIAASSPAAPSSRGERLLQTHTLIGQELQLPSFDWARAAELYLLSN